MGRRHSNQRKVNGILLLDKPAGLTSNAALQQVKRLYRARKAGHTGSLDPLASGLLPVCMGEATKVSAFLLDADKDYLVTLRLGERTSTGDAEGEVVEERPLSGVTEAGLRTAMAGFQGEIEQIPPMYSAVKHKGERLYKLARQGIEVERKPRAIVVHELRRVTWRRPLLEIEVRCTKGTYVRTLAEDIGEADHDLPVEAARTQQPPIEYVGAVGRSDHDHALISLETVHFNEQLVQSLFALVVSSPNPCAAVTTSPPSSMTSI